MGAKQRNQQDRDLIAIVEQTLMKNSDRRLRVRAFRRRTFANRPCDHRSVAFFNGHEAGLGRRWVEAGWVPGPAGVRFVEKTEMRFDGNRAMFRRDFGDRRRTGKVIKKAVFLVIFWGGGAKNGQFWVKKIEFSTKKCDLLEHFDKNFESFIKIFSLIEKLAKLKNRLNENFLNSMVTTKKGRKLAIRMLKTIDERRKFEVVAAIFRNLVAITKRDSQNEV